MSLVRIPSFVVFGSDLVLLAERRVPCDVCGLSQGADGHTQLSTTEDSLRASKSVEESLMDTLQRTIEGYETCAWFLSVTTVSY